MSRALDSSVFTQYAIYDYTAAASQTTFSGADVNGKVLSYAVSMVVVIKNGFMLQQSDFIATNGTSVVLNTACVASDSVSIVSFSSYSAADTYSQAYINSTFATKMESNGIPGQLGLFMYSTIPTGWLKADGSAVPRASYANLDAAIYCGDANNATATWGFRCTDATKATRSTTGAYIAIPDLRAEFLRGWDDGRGIDSGRTLWSFQADAFKAHTHGTYLWATVSGGAGYYSGGFSVPQYSGETGSTGGTETRPRNLAVRMCIKY